MSLATRCTSCSTVFRIVQDQLKVSEGWVRCGRCDAVFNALERLFDLDREAPADWDEPLPASDFERTWEDPAGADAKAELDLHPAPLPVAVAEARPPRSSDSAGSEPVTSTGELAYADPVDAHLFGPRKRAESAPKPAGQLGARDRLEFSDARFDSDLFAENASVPDEPLDELASTDVAALPLESTMRPDFVRRAERKARWRSTPVRVVLGIGCLLAVLTLSLQVGHHGRDLIAAQWPALRPTLAMLCRSTGCTLAAPRRIDDVLVESTGLTRTPNVDASVLAVTLRNRGPLGLAMPWVDLKLTDGNGRLVARRALAPRDFGAPEVLNAGAEAALQLTMSTGTTTVAGYTVEIFYP